MQAHVTARPPNMVWEHQETPTLKEGPIRHRFEAPMFSFEGRGGRVHIDTQRQILRTRCAEGFWVSRGLRLLDIVSRTAHGELACHASAIYKRGHLWLLAGHSGAGKSTAAMLAANQGWRVLQDDLVFLKNGVCQQAIDWNMPERVPQQKPLNVTGVALLHQDLRPTKHY